MYHQSTSLSDWHRTELYKCEERAHEPTEATRKKRFAGDRY
jgi:hypothetical protein